VNLHEVTVDVDPFNPLKTFSNVNFKNEEIGLNEMPCASLRKLTDI